MLTLEHIKKDYIIEGKRIEVLKDVNLHLEAGDRIALTGKSGTGKSTLLNIIATIENPDAGMLTINGEQPVRMGDRKLSAFRNRQIGIVFQFHHLLPEFTALENAAMPLIIGGKGKAAFDTAKEMLARVGLEHRFEHKPAELSGGEQQRVAIARALVTHPNILLLDEPTGNLDDETGRMILDLIISLADEHRLTTVFVTHNRSFVGRMAKHCELKQGVLCFD